MPDIPNPNVTIPLIIIIICGLIAWMAYGHARRTQEELQAAREERRNRNRPAEPRPQQYPAMPGSTQALPAVHPNGAAYAPAGYNTTAYNPAAYANTSYTNSGYTNSGYDNAGYDNAGYVNAGYDNAGYGNAAYDNAGYGNAAYSEPANANGAYSDQMYRSSASGAAGQDYPAYGAAPYHDPGLSNSPLGTPPPVYTPPPPAFDAPPAYNNQLPSAAYEPPAAVPPYESLGSNFPSPEIWAPPPSAAPGRDISELAPALPPSQPYSSTAASASPAQQYAEQSAADTPGAYLPSPVELEDWNRQYAPAVEEWILNHEEALDAVTVRHVPVEALDRAVVARKVELTSHLDYAAHAHPSRQQGAELSEMIDSADGTLAAMQVRDFGGAEQNHARYLSYRDIWLPRVQRALAP